MTARTAPSARVAALVVIGAVLLQIMVGLAFGRASIVAAVMTFGQIAVVGAMVLARAPHRLVWLVIGAAALTATVAIMPTEKFVEAGSGLLHAVIYLGLMTWFGRSLLADREAVITSLAKRIRGQLPPDILAYTRSITLAWCIFFALQVLVSAALFAFAPVSYWLFFVTVLNLPLVALMFAVEYACRVACFPDYQHASFREVAAAFVKRDVAIPAQQSLADRVP